MEISYLLEPSIATYTFGLVYAPSCWYSSKIVQNAPSPENGPEYSSDNKYSHENSSEYSYKNNYTSKIVRKMAPSPGNASEYSFGNRYSAEKLRETAPSHENNSEKSSEAPGIATKSESSSEVSFETPPPPN